jgi:hypothetical protein
MGKAVGKITDTLGLTDIEGTRKRGEQSAAEIRAASELAKFKPYNITTALGGVRFGPQTVDINYNPELAAYRDRLFGLAGTLLPQDIDAAKEAEYRRLVEGSRGALEQQTAQLGTGLFRTGRQGLDIYGANPETRAFASALMDRELAMRQAVDQQIANRIAQSTGAFTSGFGVEQAMLAPIDIGAGLGTRSAQAGANAAQLLSGAARTQQQAGDTASAQLTGFMNQMLNAAIGSFGGGGSMSSLFGGGGGGGNLGSGIGTPTRSSPASIYSIY